MIMGHASGMAIDRRARSSPAPVLYVQPGRSYIMSNGCQARQPRPGHHRLPGARPRLDRVGQSAPAAALRAGRGVAAAEHRKSMTRIERIDTIRLGEHPRTLWVEVLSDDGLVGLGETYYVPGAVAAVIHDIAAPHLLGQSPFDLERAWT